MVFLGEGDFGLIRPSLIKQLRSILDQYPDDGQILKVGVYRHFFGVLVMLIMVSD